MLGEACISRDDCMPQEMLDETCWACSIPDATNSSLRLEACSVAQCCHACLLACQTKIYNCGHDCWQEHKAGSAMMLHAVCNVQAGCKSSVIFAQGSPAATSSSKASLGSCSVMENGWTAQPRRYDEQARASGPSASTHDEGRLVDASLREHARSTLG